MARAVLDALEGIVHEETQTEGPGVALTAADIHRQTGRGQIDFGGGEYEPAETAPLEPSSRDPDDDYGWWELDAGSYVVAFNESLSDGAGPYVLQPHERLLALGATHPTVRVSSLPRVPLTVPDGGVAIKENARVSRLLAGRSVPRSP